MACGDRDLFRGVDIGGDGQTEVAADRGENAATFLEAGAAEGGSRRAVGFVVGGLEDERDTEAARDGENPRGGTAGRPFTFEDARTEDEEEFFPAHGDISDFKGFGPHQPWQFTRGRGRSHSP